MDNISLEYMYEKMDENKIAYDPKQIEKCYLFTKKLMKDKKEIQVKSISFILYTLPYF